MPSPGGAAGDRDEPAGLRLHGVVPAAAVVKGGQDVVPVVVGVRPVLPDTGLVVNEVLQPLVGRTTPLAVWPGGTANLVAKELGLPRDGDRAADMIAAGRTRRVSVGRAGARYFIVMAGVGMDAELVRAVNPRLKRLVGQTAFWIAWLQQLVRWRPQPFVVEVNGQRYGATFTVLANAASYGGGLRIAPQASLDSAYWISFYLTGRSVGAFSGTCDPGWMGHTWPCPA